MKSGGGLNGPVELDGGGTVEEELEPAEVVVVVGMTAFEDVVDVVVVVSAVVVGWEVVVGSAVAVGFRVTPNFLAHDSRSRPYTYHQHS